MIIEFEIPSLPPGINATYKTGRGGFYKSAEAVLWQQKASYIIGAHANWMGWEDDAEFYKIYIEIRGSLADVDASVKLIIDTITQKLGFDDSRILEQSSKKVKSDEKGILVRLIPIID